MLAGECGAEWRDNVTKAMLMRSDDINIPLDDDDCTARCDGTAGKVNAIQRLAFVTYRCLWRVEIFGLSIVERSAAKCDDFATNVANWKHEPVPKSIVNATSFVSNT